VGIFLVVGCASPPPKIQFDSVPASKAGGRDPNRSHPPLATFDDFRKFDQATFDIVSAEGAGAGVTGAKKVVIRSSDFDSDITMKLKTFPKGLDGMNNSPRKEIAAFAVQQLFLDPVDYVVPTVGVRCLDLGTWDKHVGSSPVQVAGTKCALATYAFWLQNVTLPDPLFDEQRFATDARYAYNLANFNIVTYLVDHHDNRKGNFLVSKNDKDRRVFAIDNGTTFGAFFFNWFYPPTFAWRNMKVPAIPRNTVNRLRTLKQEDVEKLGVVAQLEADSRGRLRLVEPGESTDREEGVNVRGTTLQLGLTEDEIEDVWERIEDLLEDVDEGDLGVF
jgi:hypothetical protein